MKTERGSGSGRAMTNHVLTRRALLGSALIAASGAAACLGGLPVDPVARGIARSPRTLLGLWEYAQRPFWLVRGEPGWLGSHEAMFSGEDIRGDSFDIAVRVARFADVTAARAAAAAITAVYVQRLFRTRLPELPAPVSDLLPHAGRPQRLYQYSSAIQQPRAGASYFLATSAGDIVLLLESTGLPTTQLASWATLLLAAV